VIFEMLDPHTGTAGEQHEAQHTFEQRMLQVQPV
jgi:hypothetical protein